MTQDPVLIELSFADAIPIIATSVELPEQTRRWPAPIEWSGGDVSLRMGAVPA